MKKNTNNKVTTLPVSKFIDTKFREYSLYVLKSRGIPSFYDALTPVQRYILMNSPSSFSKTLSVVGKSIEDGYSHGNVSLQKAISKLARPFGSAFQMLYGYGFFGTEVSPEPAAPRYTSVKINNHVNDILKQYSYLTEKSEEGGYDPFWVDLPIGLCTTIVGISVGYKATTLPRKLNDIKRYLNGEIKHVKPYFMDYSGKISRHKSLNNSWLLDSNINIEKNKIFIKEIPPILKYNTVLKRLDWLFRKFESKIRVINNSNTKVDITIVYSGRNVQEWDEIQTYVKKIFSIIVTEKPIFIKDDQVLVYDTVEEYLDDYKWQILRLRYYNLLYERKYLKNELRFNEVKKNFITFILQKRRQVAEIDKFLNPFDKDLQKRLERMTAKMFTKDELSQVRNKINGLKKELRVKERNLKKSKKIYEKTKDPTAKRGISSKKSLANLFDSDDVDEVNGIWVWDGEDVFDEKKKEIEDEE